MYTPKIRAAASALVLLLTLAACGESPATPTPGTSVPPTLPPVTSTPLPPTLPPATSTPVVIDHITPTPDLPAPTPVGISSPITFTVSGGIAGISHMLVILPDGRMTLSIARPPTTRTGTLTAAEQAELARLLAAVQGLALQPSYTSGRVADDFSDTILFTQAEQPMNVTIGEVGGQGLTPPALEALRAFLHDRYQSLQSTATPVTAPPGKVAPLITYAISGGVAGINETVQILPDGQLILINARSSEPRVSQITPAQLTELSSLVAAAGALHPADRYGFPPAPDQFVHTLEFRYENQPYTVTLAADSGKDQWPPAIRALDDFMQGVYQGLQK